MLISLACWVPGSWPLPRVPGQAPTFCQPRRLCQRGEAIPLHPPPCGSGSGRRGLAAARRAYFHTGAKECSTWAPVLRSSRTPGLWATAQFSTHSAAFPTACGDSATPHASPTASGREPEKPSQGSPFGSPFTADWAELGHMTTTWPVAGQGEQTGRDGSANHKEMEAGARRCTCALPGPSPTRSRQEPWGGRKVSQGRGYVVGGR